MHSNGIARGSAVTRLRKRIMSCGLFIKCRPSFYSGITLALFIECFSSIGLATILRRTRSKCTPLNIRRFEKRLSHPTIYDTTSCICICTSYNNTIYLYVCIFAHIVCHSRILAYIHDVAALSQHNLCISQVE